jgi:hypothetical protein
MCPYEWGKGDLQSSEDRYLSEVKSSWVNVTSININQWTVQSEEHRYGSKMSTSKVRESGPVLVLVTTPLCTPMKRIFRREVSEVDYSPDKNGYSYR